MTSDIIRKMLEDQERLRKLTDPFGDLVNPASNALASVVAGQTAVEAARHHALQPKLFADISATSIVGRLMKDAEDRRKMLEGPVAEARRIGLLDPHSDLRKTISAATEAQRLYEDLFRLPAKNEVASLIEQANQAKSVAASLSMALNNTESIRSAMERMTRPWLHVDDALASTNAFAELLSIGRGIADRPPFEATLVDRLRPSLGDWRDPITFDYAALINPIPRSELYLERGVDPDLTDFTVPAFHEGASLAGLSSEEVDPDTGASDISADETEDVARAEQAFAQLRRFEVAVRNFIVEVMEDAFGDKWMKRQLPKEMRDKWETKRQAEIDAGREPRALIEYADFSDYRMIIERSDNWRTAFKSVFGRPEDVRESFQRLGPIRIATMHSRIVTLDDELLLMVETKRVLRAIQVRSN